MAITLTQICEAIETTLGAATNIKSSKSFSGVTEGIPAASCPRMHVYPDEGTTDVRTATDRTTFQAGIQQTQVKIMVDVFSAVRSHVGQNLTAAVENIDSLITILEAQERPPFFGLEGIKAFRWSWKRTLLRYGNELYQGSRFSIWVKVF